MTITDIPHMGAQTIGRSLRHYAELVPEGSVIAELGVWLGAGTAYLAEGAKVSNSHVYAFDRFKATSSEIAKAKKQGWKIKGDTLPVVRRALNSLGLSEYVTLTKGNICSEPWTHGLIGLFVLDTCKGKKSFLQVVKTYSPYWIPGKTIIVLMDYWYFKKKSNLKASLYRCQFEWMQKNKHAFQEYGIDMGGTSAATFLYCERL